MIMIQFNICAPFRCIVACFCLYSIWKHIRSFRACLPAVLLEGHGIQNASNVLDSLLSRRPAEVYPVLRYEAGMTIHDARVFFIGHYCCCLFLKKWKNHKIIPAMLIIKITAIPYFFISSMRDSSANPKRYPQVPIVRAQTKAPTTFNNTKIPVLTLLMPMTNGVTVRNP
jgi:hypothetical protein